MRKKHNSHNHIVSTSQALAARPAWQLALGLALLWLCLLTGATLLAQTQAPSHALLKAATLATLAISIIAIITSFWLKPFNPRKAQLLFSLGTGLVIGLALNHANN